MSKLTKLEKELLLYLRQEIYINKDLTITELADKYYVSPSLISKLSKKLGYQGFSEMMFHLRKNANEKKEPQNITQDIVKVVENLFEFRDRKIIIISNETHRTLREYLVRRMTMFDLFVVSTYDYQMIDNPSDKEGLTIALDSGSEGYMRDILEYSYQAGYYTMLFINEKVNLDHDMYDEVYKLENTGVFEADVICFFEYVMSAYSLKMRDRNAW